MKTFMETVIFSLVSLGTSSIFVLQLKSHAYKFDANGANLIAVTLIKLILSSEICEAIFERLLQMSKISHNTLSVMATYTTLTRSKFSWGSLTGYIGLYHESEVLFFQ